MTNEISNINPRRRGAALAVAALAAAALVSACGSTKTGTTEATGKKLEVARVEKSIEQSIVGEKHMHATVSCPAVEQKQGVTFTCTATGTVVKGNKAIPFSTPFTVEQLNNKGYVYYHS
jgi:apolipoprotein N-acyltransferase